MKRLPALLLLAACRTMDDDLARIRAERQRLEREIRIAEDVPLWTAGFDPQIRDDDSNIPEHIYDHLIRKLHARGEASIRMETKEGFRFDRSLAAPGGFRGKFWRVTGTITRIWPEALEDPKAPVPRIFAGLFYVDEDQPVYFHLIEKPDALELGRDVVEIDGLFVKVLRFPLSGGRRIEAPFFIAKTMRRMM